jgi:predicted amidohydrolase
MERAVRGGEAVEDCFTVALVTEVFHGEGGEERLIDLLRRARSRGAQLALLPELPLDRWFPASRETRAEDAEPPGGRRHGILSRAAAEAGVGVVGGAVVLDAESGKRHETALVFDAEGRLAGSYRKAHLPEEEGYWETSHYQPGDDPPRIVTGFPMPFGLQICSDVNRPEGTHALAALGAEAILAPRASSFREYERWKLVLRANALTSAAYVLCVNRPRPEFSAGIGGASLAIGPGGEVLLETGEPLGLVTLSRAVVRRARKEYPGYLPVRAGHYARAWETVDRLNLASRKGVCDVDPAL